MAAVISEVTTICSRRLRLLSILKRLESQLELIDARSPITIMVRLLLTTSWTIRPVANTGREPMILTTSVIMYTANQQRILLK